MTLVASTNGQLLNGIGECVVGLIFLLYGLTRKPLDFNESNPWKGTLSIWMARLIYIPFALIAFFFGGRDLIRVLK